MRFREGTRRASCRIFNTDDRASSGMPQIIPGDNMDNSERSYSSAAARKREREKKKRRRLYYALILFAVCVCFAVLTLTVFFNIREIKIVGSTKYTAEEIAQASGITVGDNMLRENISQCSGNITSSLIYIESAEVKKKYPYTIQITVEPCVPNANVQTMNGYFLISKSGKILEKINNPRPGLLTINGAEGDITLMEGDRFASLDEKKTEEIYELISAFENFGMDSVTYIDISDRADVWFLYDSRVKVELGVISELDYRLRFIDEILRNKIGSNTSGTLRLLNDSAQFIDEAGLAENDRVYEQNIATSTAETTEDDALAAESSSGGGEEESAEQTEENAVTEVPAEETEIVTVSTTME